MGSSEGLSLALGDLGRAGGRLETGRVLDYSKTDSRQMCRLYLSMMEKMGVRTLAELAFTADSWPS